jgi:hypothetical protein
MTCERQPPSLSRTLPFDGLSVGELEALAVEGQPKPVYGGSIMDRLMKLFMGGWIPQGKRTQWAAFGVALSAVVVAFVQWGSGEMNLTELMKLLGEKWEILAFAFGGYFVAEKIDAAKK